MNNKKIAALFPGQGSQYIGMCNKFADNKCVNLILEQASNKLNIDIKKMCNEENKDIFKTEFAQPIILTVSYIMYKLYRELGGDVPDIALGHSLGEFSALTCAGCISFEDALELVSMRGKLMSTVDNGYAMTAVVNVSYENLEKVIAKMNEKIYISNYNSPTQVVISAKADIIGKFEKEIEILGGNTKRLKTSQPFHTEIMQGVAIKFEEYINKCKFSEPEFHVISNVTAEVHKEELIKKRLIQQIYKPVNFTQCMKTLRRRGIENAIEFGAGNVLTRIAIQNYNEISAYAMDEYADRKQLNDLIKFNKNKSVSLLYIVNLCLAEVTGTKFENYIVEAHRGLNENYKKLELIRNNLEQSNSLSHENIEEKCVELLKKCLMLKNVPMNEQNSILTNITSSFNVYKEREYEL
ncbi:ACP S-malonyltransferase [Clostridium sp. CM028]|uniref:ACP S-malonyltransferase n=1 Tax=unclassified Clostridium TaxID=2614128 RepID=UPI001C6E7EE7|nr:MULTISPECIES: ACP S-malonyltransferase [unclassified Clostridium]MBW9145950.1 ACP S-malonyltransferase [Clostridium sp. CM027]MBW9149637.1 ACP S-malonyltransferase [Clostridium sp. CM028]UVE40925.1 ACP S-malonyltransferase [Clostridium sp. CM027]WLC61592.1 ACP S-malonyltransferase [Clostridium sp. CM028]